MPTSTATTTVPADLLSITLTSGSATPEKGGAVTFDICVNENAVLGEGETAVFVSYSSSNESVALTGDIDPADDDIAPGVCRSTSMTGRSEPGALFGLGDVQLFVTVDGVDFHSQIVTFVEPAAPTSTATETVEEDRLTISILSGSDIVLSGQTVTLEIYLRADDEDGRFVSYSSSEESVALTGNIDPPDDVYAAGECRQVVMTGQDGAIGQVQLIANLEGFDYSSPIITFIEQDKVPGDEEFTMTRLRH